MAVITPAASDPVSGYEALAPYYDVFTSTYDYETWVGAIENLALKHGLSGQRVLDVACGTGKSFEPLLARGYQVTACDISPEMVAAAAGKFAGHGVDLFVADMRRLPRLGPFDLITCLDDSLNYLLDEADLEDALHGMADCLTLEGLLAFDCNSACAYESAFSSQFVRDAGDLFFAWRGEGTAEDGLARATIDIFARESDSWVREMSSHVQRHHPISVVEAVLRRAGLDLVACHGQLAGGRLEPDPDEQQHPKVLYLARRSRAGHGKEVPT
jgi:SAM-dependent methyltransferase